MNSDPHVTTSPAMGVGWGQTKAAVDSLRELDRIHVLLPCGCA